jgi:amino acid transporter
MVKAFKEIFKITIFWKFMVLMLLLVGVRMVFIHMDMTFPKYMLRTHGEDVLYGSILSINPFLIMFLVPLFAPLALHMSAYN